MLKLYQPTSIKSMAIQSYEVVKGERKPVDFAHDEMEQYHDPPERGVNLAEGHLVFLAEVYDDRIEGTQCERISVNT